MSNQWLRKDLGEKAKKVVSQCNQDKIAEKEPLVLRTGVTREYASRFEDKRIPSELREV